MIDGIIVLIIAIGVICVVKHLCKAKRQGNLCAGCSCAGTCGGSCGGVSNHSDAFKK